MTNNKQITVPVKKSDGSVVRMTLDEFKKYKQTGKMDSVGRDKKTTQSDKEKVQPKENPNIVIPKVAEDSKQKNNLPQKAGVDDLSTTTPVKDIYKDEAMAKSKSNAGSPVSDKKKKFKFKDDNIITKQKKNDSMKKQNNDTQEKKPTKKMYEFEKSAESSQNNKNTKKDLPKEKKPNSVEDNKESSTQKKNTDSGVRFEWDDDDNKSLLEEDLNMDQMSEGSANVVNSYEDIVKEIMGRLTFPVDKELKGRLEVLVTTRVKGVRSDDQVVEYAQKSPDSGGLGLQTDQIREMLAAIHTIMEKHGKDIKAVKEIDGNMSIAGLEKNMSDKQSEKSQPESSEKKDTHEPAPIKPQIKELKPTMRDIEAPATAKTTMGPVEEIRSFNLMDFRRLAKDANKSAELLHDKLAVLKEESFLLYMDAVQAWFESPLYRSYQSVIRGSLKEGKTIEQILAEGKEENINSSEFNAIVGLNSKLNR
ncbi:MAG: hypothetical protein GF349_04250 [Candidatus Magasanikbacteria bacterium]|nr:hypothetical protein [Candidatus Magasanikbacteria bacterium]